MGNRKGHICKDSMVDINSILPVFSCSKVVFIGRIGCIGILSEM
jgi:hypothetical protein